MVQFIIINKYGNIIEDTYDNVNNLYKNCGHKTNKQFNKQHTWNIQLKNQTYNITLYAKSDGHAGNENKYDLPPPKDTNLYFDTMALISENGDLTKSLWNKLYEHLFGGFYNLDDYASEDENESDELEEYPDEMKTSTGYLKDGFVVSDEDEDEDNFISDDEEAEFSLS